jgi:hypothetical protein
MEIQQNVILHHDCIQEGDGVEKQTIKIHGALNKVPPDNADHGAVELVFA